jgi:hypothetical protein
LLAKRITSIGGNMVPAKLIITAAGEVLVTGSYTGSVSVDGVNLPSTAYNDGFILKLNSAGTVIAAASTGGIGARYTIIFSVASDATGNLYVVGRYSSNAHFDSTVLTTTGSNFFVAKLNSLLAWQYAVTGTFISGTNPTAELFDVVLDATDNLYTAGRFSGSSLQVGSTVLVNGPYDVLTVVLDSGLNFLAASQAYTSGGQATALARDINGNIWQLGEIMGTGANFSGTIVSSTNPNHYLAKVSSSAAYSGLVSGAGSSGTSFPHDLVIGSNNNIITTGYASGSVSFGNINLNPSGTSLYVAVYIP